jgi:hypothetical protein
MPKPSKFKGFEVLGDDEPFKVGDYYYPAPYYMIDGKTFSIDTWGKVSRDNGPSRIGQTFFQRHNTTNYTVIRRITTYSGIPRRLAMNRFFATQLPLP